MTAKYITIRIRIANRETVRMEIYGDGTGLSGEPTGQLNLNPESIFQIKILHHAAINGEISEPDVKRLGELLFSSLLDEKLKHEFLNLYHKAQQENAVLRMELDVDERTLPGLAVLPWEFMHVPSSADHGSFWPATAPNVVFSRWRSLRHFPEPIQLKLGERLRIAMAVAAPQDEGVVKYQRIWKELKENARTERIDLLPIISPANRFSIDEVLEQSPHIFHFIGHGRLKDENNNDSGQVALVDDFGSAEWVNADHFSELFSRHKPGLVLLQSCESGARSDSNAFTGVASQIVQMNIPAVVAMQFVVSNPTAQRFALEFYKRLAENAPVDKAAQEARRRIALGPSGYKSRDFATPVLFMRVREGSLFQRQTDFPEKSTIIERLKNEVSSMEQNANFDEAVKSWKDIRDLDPNDREIEPALKRLKEKSRNQHAIRELKHQLSRRRDDLDRPLYIRVTKFLTQMEKAPPGEEDKIYMELVRDFLEGNISPEDFQQSWEADASRPGQNKEPNYQLLAKRLMRGDFVPFIGSEILYLSGLPVPPSPEMAREMAERIKYHDFNGTRPMISQYYRMEGYSKGMVAETVKNMLKKNMDPCLPNPVYDVLSEIDAPIMIISSSYDNLLECIFKEKGKKFAVGSHYVFSSSEDDFGKILVKYSDKPGVETLCTAEELSSLELLENRYTFIYKVCGGFCTNTDEIDDREQAAAGGKADPLLLLENDFFSFSRHLEQLIPDYIIQRLLGRGFLFLGYSLEEWQDRLIAHAFLEKSRGRTDSSYSVWPGPSRFNRIFWKSNQVDILNEELKHFATRLSENIRHMKNEK